MSTIEIRIGDAAVNKLRAAEALAVIGGVPVTVVEVSDEGELLGEVDVSARYLGWDGLIEPRVNWAAHCPASAAEGRAYAALIILASEVAELATMIGQRLAA
jgi:hypothetical protein